MAIAVAATRQILADAYKNAGNRLAACKGDPGNGPSVANELSGTGPEGAYARATVNGTSGTGGAVTYPNATINAPATGSAYEVSWVALCSGATGNNMIDKARLVDANGNPDPRPVGPLGGVIVVTNLTFTQT